MTSSERTGISVLDEMRAAIEDSLVSAHRGDERSRRRLEIAASRLMDAVQPIISAVDRLLNEAPKMTTRERP